MLKQQDSPSNILDSQVSKQESEANLLRDREKGFSEVSGNDLQFINSDTQLQQGVQRKEEEKHENPSEPPQRPPGEHNDSVGSCDAPEQNEGDDVEYLYEEVRPDEINYCETCLSSKLQVISNGRCYKCFIELVRMKLSLEPIAAGILLYFLTMALVCITE